MSQQYSVFNKNKVDATKEPMFLGQSVNVARYDVQHFPIFEKLTEKALSFFWTPSEIDLSRDRGEYESLPEHEKHIFLSNLKYQSLLDAVQGRSPNLAFLPLVSIPELEAFVEVWSCFEVIHSRSYTHIIRNIVVEPSLVFDGILEDKEILKRAKDIAFYYDDLIEYSQWYNLLGVGTHQVNGKEIVINKDELIKKIILAVISVYGLEGCRFYVSFAASWSFAERKLMEGNAKIIKLVARDEGVHMNATSAIINIWRNFNDQPEFSRWYYELQPQIIDIFKAIAEQEKEWCDYLFKDGSMIGLNANILKQYVEFMVNVRMKAIGLDPLFPERGNPLPWTMHWIDSTNLQQANQEGEQTSYLVGAIDANLGENPFADFEL